MYLVYVFRFSHRQKDLKNTVRNSYLQKLCFWWCAHVPLILHTHIQKKRNVYRTILKYFKITFSNVTDLVTTLLNWMLWLCNICLSIGVMNGKLEAP